MPELPEVETIRRGIEPFILHKKVTKTVVRHESLRWPIPKNLPSLLEGQKLLHLHRRSKYLIFEFPHGNLIIHLGMSGRLRVGKKEMAPQKHDHVDIYFANGIYLRFTDPRRFGAILWAENITEHKLLKNLGPEPLTKAFHADYLYEQTRNKKVSIKVFLMNGKNVTGVGNIYAAEALFLAGIHPEKKAGDMTRKQSEALVDAIKAVLQKAIKSGGTTLKDFSNHEGIPGYFAQKLQVYGRENLPCYVCKTTLRLKRLGQRSTVFCPICQKK